MSFESRLSRAVYLALSLPAAQVCACAGAQAPPTPAPAATSPTPPQASGPVLAVAVPDAGSTAAPIAMPPDAMTLCQAYRDAHQEPKQPAAKPVEVELRGYDAEVQGWPLGDGRVQCRLAWSRTKAASPVKRLITPVCCQRNPGPHPPCPPAAMESLPTMRATIEEVTLSSNGNVIKSGAHVELQFEEPPRHACGRRPESATLTPTDAEDEPVAVALRTMAELESVSVTAFERLAHELSAFGAPSGLVNRARAAAADEIRHAHVMEALARDAGHPPAPRVATPLYVRTVFEVALENAVEGCVYETYGAVTALFQVQRVAYPHLRAALASIASDETAHAALAWDLDRWFASQLSKSEVAQLDAAKARAVERLAHRIATHEAPQALGFPNRAEAETLREATFADLLAA